MLLLTLRNIFRSFFNPPYEIYTDGSFKEGRGSWAYVIVQKRKVLRESFGGARKTASNPMEFQAAIEALKALPADSRVTLYSDSRILIDTMTLWRTEWKAQGWLKKNGAPLPFVEQIKILDALSEYHSVSWKWVKAHAGNEYNERCDELCIRARNSIVLIILFLFSISFSTKAGSEPSKHLVQQESYWGHSRNKTINEKLISASPEVIDYLTQDNIKNGWSNRPRPAVLMKEYQKDLLQALRELPLDLAEKINRKLAAIVVVDNLGSSGYSDYIFDAKGNLAAGFVVLDVSVLNKTANAWATWKEGSPFKADGNIQIVAEIENAKEDNRKNALQYVLLHEFGHIVSIGLNSVAPWGVAENTFSSFNKFTFTSLSWEIQNERFVSHFDGTKIDRTGLRYYGDEDKRLASSRAEILYTQIKNTNFPTLYAATNPHDDFAESFATYIHSVLMKRPWKIKIVSDQKNILELNLCWQEMRCNSKRKVLEEILSHL